MREHLLALLRCWARCGRGSVTLLFALVFVAIAGCAALAFDYGRAFSVKTQLQSAVDSAVLSAVALPAESRDAAARSYFQSKTVDMWGLTAEPSFSSEGEKFTGTAAVNVPTSLGALLGIASLPVAVTATAELGPGSTSFCILALAESGAEGIETEGASKSNIGCNIMSNTSATCHGHDLRAPIASAHTYNDGCGLTQKSGVRTISDPYAERSAHIPLHSCGSFPQRPTNTSNTPLPLTNRLSGIKSLSGTLIICGDLQLTGDTIIDAPTGALVVIVNGALDLNGHKLSTAAGSGVTFVLTGENNPSYQHILIGGGVLDIVAPTSGPWSGIAIYQDPSLDTNVDIAYNGNSPAWNVTGLIYMPRASMSFSGAVGKGSYGSRCLALVVDNISINGTGSIFANNTQCAAAGLKLPVSMDGVRLSR